MYVHIFPLLLHIRLSFESIFLRVLDMSVVQASKMAAVSMLKTWPGLFCLCSPHNTGLVSLLNMLPLTQMEVQVREGQVGV